MKENQIEFVFIGVIIIVFAIWKISELIKTRCYQAKAAIQEGFEADDRAKKDKAAAVAAATAEPELMTQLKGLLKNYKTETPVLSTENFTVETPENEMTINQRKKAATTLDTFNTATTTATTTTATTTTTTPPPVAAPTTDKPINSVKEGLENPDENTKEFIDKNITSINPADSQSKFKLRDYYIKSAYNAFNPDKFKNSNVSMDALLYVIARGCRFIDFEVFSVENQPVIASSSVNSFNYKETFNHIPVSDAFEVLGSYVFSGSKCPNPGDPFIIHMRIMSRNVTMYDNLAKIISQSKTMARNLLGPKYGREFQTKDLGNENLLNFKGKIILMVDGTNQIYRKTRLLELINMSSNSLFLSKYTYFGVKNIADPQTFKDSNKKNMCLVIPDKAGRPINDGHNGPYTWGCQIAAMCFQEEVRDEKLKAYEDKFASVGYAFILKPEDLRYVPITIAPPAPPNPKSSMESRPVEAAGDVKFDL
jgi:Na+-transporting methylmalonyl-CoA/oxaloacetate decarboxylase gamma subunit